MINQERRGRALSCRCPIKAAAALGAARRAKSSCCSTRSMKARRGVSFCPHKGNPNVLSPRQGMGGLFWGCRGAGGGGGGVDAEKQPTRGANKMPIHLLSFTLIPPTVSFSFLRLLRHKTTNSEREWKHWDLRDLEQTCNPRPLLTLHRCVSP